MKSRIINPTIEEFLPLQAFSQRCHAAPSPHWYGRVSDYHMGDLWWSFFTGSLYHPGTLICAWEDEQGEVVAYASAQETGLSMQIHPDYRHDWSLVGEILAWGEEKTRAEGLEELWIWAFDSDPESRDFFEQVGYERDPDNFHMLHHVRDLNVPIPDLPLPDRLILRNVGGEAEVMERLETHRDAFAPSRLTEAIYRKARSAPAYQESLDIVLATPENTFVAYCICWYDPINHYGLFEPVGTRKIHHGKGFGKQVMFEGLRRMKALGAERASVISAGNNPSATGLYHSIGMQTVDKSTLYGRKLK